MSEGIALSLATIIGSLAGLATSSSLLPQLIKAWKTKSVRDLSLGMLVVLSVGLFLWIIYGIMVRAWPVIITNIFSLIQALMLVVIKVRNDAER